MKKTLLTTSLIFSLSSSSHENPSEINFEKTVYQCAKDGCTVVCHEPGARWDTFLESVGELEVTYYFSTGVRQMKAKDKNGEITILDTNPSYQACRISGIKK